MDYLFTTVLWFIFSVIGYAAFWKDWKNLKKCNDGFLLQTLDYPFLQLPIILFNSLIDIIKYYY